MSVLNLKDHSWAWLVASQGQQHATIPVSAAVEVELVSGYFHTSHSPPLIVGRLDSVEWIAWNGTVEWNSGMEYWNATPTLDYARCKRRASQPTRRVVYTHRCGLLD